MKEHVNPWTYNFIGNKFQDIEAISKHKLKSLNCTLNIVSTFNYKFAIGSIKYHNTFDYIDSILY